MRTTIRKSGWRSAVFAMALAMIPLTMAVLPTRAAAQDGDQDDPPSRVARLGYMEGSVSFLPAGETEWVGAVPNRPMTTGDQLWTDQGARAEIQLGSAVIRMSANTGFSFLDLDDQTVQIQLTSGAISVTVRRLGGDDDFEVDTPNQAFTISQPGHYRVEASSDGNYTVISIREGEGEATGNGQDFRLHGGQRGTFSGTDQLYAEVSDLGDPDGFDNWAQERDHRYDYSRSAQYLSHDVVGYEDLDDYGDWRDDGNYGHVWFPNRVEAGWAPYHTGHWAWISPWGYTWVDDAPWGYAPFHYGRWVSVGGRWGWVAGPPAVHAVYAPALVVFVGGGPGGFGGNVGWFPLGPREVYVPSYHVSEAYVNRVNVSNTTVNVTQVTNVYHTTVINNTTTNVTYVNRSVQGAVVVVPQRSFASAQPVAKTAVVVNARDIAAAPVSARVAVAPTHEAVQGGRASSAGHVAAPPAAIASRQVVAKKTPPPPPVAFAKQQQALAAHPGQPLARSEVQTLRPAAAAAARPAVRVAPPGKPATAAVGKRGAPPSAAHPGQPVPAANQPNRPGNPPAANEHPAAAAPAQPNRPAATPPSQPAPAQLNRPAMNPPNNHPEAAPPSRPEPNQPAARPEPNRPAAAPPSRPQPSQPEPNRPENRPPAAQPNNRPEPARPNNQPPPKPAAPAPTPRPQTPPPAEHPQPHNPPPTAQRPAAPPPARTPPPAAAKPAPPSKPPAKPQTPEEKKREQEKKPQGI